MTDKFIWKQTTIGIQLLMWFASKGKKTLPAIIDWSFLNISHFKFWLNTYTACRGELVLSSVENPSIKIRD